MLIYCPKCSTGYEIDENLVKGGPRKVRCSNCSEIFEVGNLIQKSVENVDDMEDISEENAFSALAAMMRDADIFEEEPVSEVVNNNVSEDNIFEESVLIESYKDVSKEEQENIKTEINDEKDINLPDDNDDVVVESDIKNVIDEVEVNEKVTESEEVNEEGNEDNQDNKDNENDDGPINIDSIYERLSEHTSHLIERENALPIYEKIWFKIKDVLGFHFKIRWIYVFIAFFIFVSLSLFNNRYEIVRKLPFMNGVYKSFGIKAKIAGEGLEFQNIIWEYVEEAGVKKLELKGFINNATLNTVAVPIVHVEILDKNTMLLQSFNRELKEKEVSSANRIPLQIIVENPAPNAKYVYFTFIDKE